METLGLGKQNITAMIPARMGSERLPLKNLAMLDGKPLIYYAITAAKEAGIFSKIVVNSEGAVFGKIAARYQVDFYQRPAQFAASDIKSDMVIDDFIRNNPCDILAWVNPISPLQTKDEIRDIAAYFIREGLDSLITVKDEQSHCVYKGKPVNFRLDEVFARTQELVPVQSLVYSVMMWRTEVFKQEFEKKGYAIFCGKTGFYPVSKASAIIIKREEDLFLAESLLKLTREKNSRQVKYDAADEQ